MDHNLPGKPAVWRPVEPAAALLGQLPDLVVPGGTVLAGIRREEGREARRAGVLSDVQLAFISNCDSSVILHWEDR